MDFWEAQRKARSRTSLYIATFIFLTVFVAVGIEVVLRASFSDDYHTPIPLFGLIFVVITCGVAAYQYASFSIQGGAYVADSLGAQKVDLHTTDPKKMQLLNIVNEIALAAGINVPPVYVMDNSEINAFAAGTNADNMIITVTTGTLNLLNRDELQGVIAHEVGHIYNQDVKISMQLAAMVMGFYIIFIMGLRILQFAPRTNREEKGGINFFLIAIILLVAGVVTWFFGSILKACVSRQREYLADACAVQFTRNPDGILNALKKIQKSTQRHEMPKEGIAFSHLYFDDYSSFTSLFATHPSLEKRIAAIEGKTYFPTDFDKPQ